LYDEALEVFCGGLAWSEREELLADVEVEALGAGEVDFVGVLFKPQSRDGGEAVGASEGYVFGVVEVEDVVAKGRGVEASVALEGVAGL